MVCDRLENTGVMALGHIAVTGFRPLFRFLLTKVTTGLSRLESALADLSQSAGTRRVSTP